jgi:hypothetical protein
VAILLLAAAVVTLAAAPARAGVEATHGLAIIDAAARDPRTVVLPILQCKLDGFVEDVSEYRAWAVKRSASKARIIATVPAAGTYYPGFIFYDGPGNERIGIFIDGREAGTAVANLDDNRQRLFYLSEPRVFKGGETIELRALTTSGAYRTEDLLLLAQKPPSRQPDYRISNLHAHPQANSVGITWLTTWPAKCVVEASSGNTTEPAPLNNHRVDLRGLEAGRTYRYRIVAQDREGRQVESAWQTFRTAAPPAARGSASSARLPLRLEPGALPVTAGIPFARGALASDQQLRLLDAASSEIPVQARVLHRWDDGSVKWVLLDFDTGTSGVTLEYGTRVRRKAAPSPLRVAETASDITVNTGRIAFTVSKRQFGLFNAVSLDGVEIIRQPAAFTLTAQDGTLYTNSAPPEEVVVEESGPVRAVIRVKGHHHAPDGRKLFTYTVRIHAWAGRPFVRIQHTFGNDNPSPDFTSFRSLALRIPLAGAAARWAVGDSFTSSAPIRLKQHTDDAYTIEPDMARGKRAEGRAEWSDGRHTVTLAVRDFWQNYPKDLAVGADGFELGLCPPLRENEYDHARGTMDEHRLYYYLQGGLFKLRHGVTKTHDFWLEFGGAPAAIRAAQQVRMAAAPPAWYASSRVFGELSVSGPRALLDRYDLAFSGSLAGYMRDRERSREYGMLNFGDWWGERYINWGNSEYDTQHAFLMQFARSGVFAYFRRAEEMEWHNRDVDTVHDHADPRQEGAVYGHAIGHTGDYYTQRPTAGAPPGGFAEGSPRSFFSPDHTFVEGHFDYYFLTGDRRSFDTAISTVNRYDSFPTVNYDFNNCRQPGWHLIMSMAAYDATGDPYYLNAARLIVERVLERQTPDGGWKRQMVPGHCYCTPRHMGNAGFMVGVLLTGLRHYYEATADERVAASIVKGARFLVDDMWVPEARGFRYTSCPKSSMGAWSNFLLFDGIVFAQRRTGDARLRQVLISGTPASLDNMVKLGNSSGGAQGKGFTQFTRVVPHFLDFLAGLLPDLR